MSTEQRKEYLKEWRRNNSNYQKEWRKRNPGYQKELRDRDREYHLTHKRNNYKQTQHGNINAHRAYSQNEDMLIIHGTMTDRELHTLIGRSVQGIQQRRLKLKSGLASSAGVI